MREHFNSMAKHLESMTGRHTLSKIFNDFLTMAVCAYHPVNLESNLQKKDLENELLYMDTIKPYNREEIHTFPKVLTDLQLEICKNPFSDPLGDYFQEHISSGRQGQFFTPDPVCTLMTKLQGTDPIDNKTVYDPACGSGRTFLNFAKDYPNNLFVGNDISPACVKMAALNLFFHNLSAEINWMDSLSGDWYGGWHINTNKWGIQPIEKEQSIEWNNAQHWKSKTPEPPPIILDYRTNEKREQPPTEQMNLFDP